MTAWAGIKPGDDIEVHGVTFTGEVQLSKVLASPAEVHFDAATKFTGAAAGSQLPAVWVNGIQNVYFFGGDITGAGNQGIRFDADKATTLWWGWSVHNTAGSCVYINGGNGITGLDLRGSVSDCGYDLSLDPHAEKGSGMHGVNIGGGSGPVTNSKLAFTITNQPYGACIQISGLQNSTLWEDANGCTFVATQQTGGNAIQFWGSGVVNLDVPYFKANNLGGPGETSGHGGQAVNCALGSDSSGIVFDYARATNVTGSPVYGTCSAIRYVDKQP